MKLCGLSVPRRLVLILLVATLLVALWLLAALAVAYRLTSRDRPRFAEPVPMLSWGELEPLRLKTRDGEDLGAWLYTGPQQGPAVVLLHGNGGCRTICLDRARILAASGCSVLMPTLRAHGDSTGARNDIGFSARHDVIAAVELLEHRWPGKPILVHGTSLGAAAAIFAAAELGRRVQGYILESPYQDLKVAVRNRTENALPPLFDWLAYKGLLAASMLVLPELEKISPLAAIGGIPDDVPVLILAGTDDQCARPAEASALHGRIRGHSRLIVFEGAGHMTFPYTNPAHYARSLGDFLSRITRPAR